MATAELPSWKYKEASLRNSHSFHQYLLSIYYIHSFCFGACKDAKDMVSVLNYPTSMVKDPWKVYNKFWPNAVEQR